MTLMDLFRPKWKHSDFRVRIAAIAQVEDQRILVEAAKGDSRPEVRMAAVAKLEDERLFADIAIADPVNEVRDAVLRRVRNQTLLRQIASESQYEWTAKAALKAITDQSLIADVAVHQRQSRNVTVPAVKMLTAPQMLARVVLEVEDSYLIGLAVERIQDEALLLELLAKVRSYMGPHMIVSEGSFSDESLILIARRYPDQKSHAIKRIKSPKALAEFALRSSEAADRLSAVEQIDDQAILIDVARNDTDTAVRVAATARVTDEGVAKDLSEDLQRVVNRELGSKDWPIAWRSLAHAPRLLAILGSVGAKTCNCPYYDSGCCMVRVVAQRDLTFGPEACSWLDQPHRECHVWKLHPR